MAGDEADGGERPAPSEREEYAAMLLLERLESLREEMEELGVRSLEDVERQIEALHVELNRDEG